METSTDGHIPLLLGLRLFVLGLGLAAAGAGTPLSGPEAAPMACAAT